MTQQTDSRLRRFLRHLRDGLSGARTGHEMLADVNRRLDRIEAQLEVVQKIWMRTRHLEPAVQAMLRERYLDRDELPYPEKLVTQRFRLA